MQILEYKKLAYSNKKKKEWSTKTNKDNKNQFPQKETIINQILLYPFPYQEKFAHNTPFWKYKLKLPDW